MDRQSQRRGDLQLAPDFAECLVSEAIFGRLLDDDSLAIQGQLDLRVSERGRERQIARHRIVPVELIFHARFG